MTFIIPNRETKIAKQLNENDLFGDIFSTKNIDLRNKGYIKLSHLPIALFTEDDDANFSTADAMFKGREVYINSDDLFAGTPEIGGSWTNRNTDTNAPTPNVEDDGIFFNGCEVVTDTDDIYYNSATTTTWTILDIDTVAPVQVAVFDYYNSLLVGCSNWVKMINTSWTVSKTLTLPVDYSVTALDVNGNTVYIGTRHNESGEGKLFVWDGLSTAWNGQYGVDAVEISTLRKYGASCALLTSKGQLLQFNGASFTVLGNLPVYYYFNKTEWEDAINDHDHISNRGMYVDKDIIYLKVNLAQQSDYNPNLQSGVWCYTPENGLFCLNTASYNRITTKTIANSNINTTDNTITSSATVPITGTQVRYEPFGDLIGGLSEYETYYIIKISDTVFKLASSYQNAIDNIAIDLTSQGGTYHNFYFLPYYDYGQTYTNDRGAILILPNSLIYTYDGKKQLDNIIYTTDLKLPAKTVLNGATDMFNNRGYFITPKLTSGSIEDKYDGIVIKHKQLKDEDKIIIKYRTVDKLSIPFGSFSKGQSIVGTWTDTNTFTTTLDMSNAEVGDEIEIVAGKGSGMLFHIDSLVNNSGTWTVNLDESFDYAVLNDTMYFYVNNFKKIKSIGKNNTDGVDYISFNLDENSKFIQLKIELRGKDVTIEELQVINSKLL